MTGLSIDEHFRRFRQTGAPADLAEVYDRCAPELLRVAMHLADKPADAEDLVQTTFLTAIERAASFDPKRRVLPWLLGILANCARNRRRLSGSRPLAGEVEPVVAENPIELAEATEFSRALDAAIAKLPEAYQPVFTLRFRHGLATPEIAKALGRPPGTVRTQLVRGLELLRRSLPASFAGTVAAMLVADRGLDAVRGAVLAHAASASQTAAMTSLGVVLMTKKAGLLVVVLATLLATLVTVLSMSGTSATPEPGVAVGPIVPAGSKPTMRETPGPAAPSRSNIVRSAVPGNTLAVVGRCVTGEAGEPLPGCSVGVRLQFARDLSSRDYAHEDAPLCTCRADGSFRAVVPIAAAIPETDRVTCGLDVRIEGRATVNATVGFPATAFRDSTFDIGDVRMWVGFRVRGRVVDRNGVAVPGASVGIKGLPNPLLSPYGRGQNGAQTLGKTTSDGSFASKPVPVGTWPLVVRGNGIKLVSPERIEVDPMSPKRVVAIVVEREQDRPSITGRVLDAAGVPIAGLRVQARWDWPEQMKTWSPADGGGFVHPRNDEILRGTADTDSMGRFRIVAADDDPPDVHLGSFGWSRHKKLCEPFHDPRTVAWNTTGIELVAKRVTSLEVKVVEAGTADPVEKFAVFCYPAKQIPSILQPLWHGRGSNGTARMVPPGSGEHWLIVAPKRRDLLPSPRQRVQIASAGPTHVDVELEHARPIRVRVVRDGGSPVVGTRLRLYDATGIADKLEPDLGQVTEYRQVFAGGPSFVINRHQPPNPFAALFPSVKNNPDLPSSPLVTDEAVTDGTGRVTLHGPKRGSKLALHLLGPGHVKKLVDSFVAGEHEVTVSVERGAQLEVSLQPLSVLHLPGGVGLQLTHEDHRSTPGRTTWCTPQTATYRETTFDDKGIVCEDDLMPGHWTLISRFSKQELELTAGKTEKLELDCSRFVPARCEGRVLVDGKVPEDAAVSLVVVDDGPLDGPQASARTLASARIYGVDGNGRFVAPLVCPGEYVLRLWIDKSRGNNRRQYPASAPFRLAPGGSLRKGFSFHHRRLRVRVVGADGKTPVAKTRFVVRGTPRFEQRVTTDEQGRFVLDPAPDHTIELTLHGKGPWIHPVTAADIKAIVEGRKAFGPFAVPDESVELVVRLR